MFIMNVDASALGPRARTSPRQQACTLAKLSNNVSDGDSVVVLYETDDADGPWRLSNK